MPTTSLVAITGNTFPVKDRLKALGARWNGDLRAWMVTPDKAEQARQIVVGAGSPAPRPTQRRQFVPTTPAPARQRHVPLVITDIPAEAAKHGRTATGAALVQFDRESGKGEGSVIGEIFWGKSKGVRARYLIVDAESPYYVSRSTLEDMDNFTTEPGWYRAVRAVAVEATEDEIANDPAAAKLREEALKDRRREIERAVQSSPQATDPRLATITIAGLEKCWGDSRSAGSETLYSDGVRLVYVTSAWNDGGATWELTDSSLAEEALSLTV